MSFVLDLFLLHILTIFFPETKTWTLKINFSDKGFKRFIKHFTNILFTLCFYVYKYFLSLFFFVFYIAFFFFILSFICVFLYCFIPHCTFVYKFFSVLISSIKSFTFVTFYGYDNIILGFIIFFYLIWMVKELSFFQASGIIFGLYLYIVILSITFFIFFNVLYLCGKEFTFTTANSLVVADESYIWVTKNLNLDDWNDKNNRIPKMFAPIPVIAVGSHLPINEALIPARVLMSTVFKVAVQQGAFGDAGAPSEMVAKVVQQMGESNLYFGKLFTPISSTRDSGLFFSNKDLAHFVIAAKKNDIFRVTNLTTIKGIYYHTYYEKLLTFDTASVSKNFLSAIRFDDPSEVIYAKMSLYSRMSIPDYKAELLECAQMFIQKNSLIFDENIVVQRLLDLLVAHAYGNYVYDSGCATNFDVSFPKFIENLHIYVKETNDISITKFFQNALLLYDVEKPKNLQGIVTWQNVHPNTLVRNALRQDNEEDITSMAVGAVGVGVSIETDMNRDKELQIYYGKKKD